KPSYDRPPLRPREPGDPSGPAGCGVRQFNDAGVGGAGTVNGDLITDPSLQNNTNELLLTPSTPTPDAQTAASDFGLDGYWENRATYQGLKVIVGQRLELLSTDSIPVASDATFGIRPGDAITPNADDLQIQPLLLSNEARQRLTMRDNLAAVQATAVYHYRANSGLTPVACLATTVHPGSPGSLQRSSTFRNGADSINFFTGTGTNVWEFDPPSNNGSDYESGPLHDALRNLANFAGDPDGSYPPLQEDRVIHPDPFMSRFGNFSELRRVMDRLDGGTAYGALSIAERTTLQTSACMVGMLAWNIEDLAVGNRPTAVPGSVDQAIREDIDDIRDRGPQGNWLNNPTTVPNRVRQAYLPLAYIFPRSAFTDAAANPGRVALMQRAQAGDTTPSYNPGVTYTPVNPDASTVILNPRPNVGAWVTPTTGGTCTTGGPNSNDFDMIQVGGTCVRVAFKDSAFYDGREAMAVRALNIDLELLTNETVDNDTWLPSGLVNDLVEGGIFYAFREDAVREDAVARPELEPWNNYLNAWNASAADLNGCTGNNGRIMNAGQPEQIPGFNICQDDNNLSVRGPGARIGDPPLDDNLQISPKSVDYYPDPDRRPYGFRLRRGEVIQRGGSFADGVYGLSFITDSGAYIQGDFNLHQEIGSGAALEEFNDPLIYAGDGSYANFYTRAGGTGGRSDLFARALEDSWRPSDILADSVNILSEDFAMVVFGIAYSRIMNLKEEGTSTLLLLAIRCMVAVAD
ncbi:MAG: hypothetical protein HC921_22385, partial [Synechococcaceae cyanobacterium SM2_3_1]|nr:hypothetical protein [Synechococcaceae cyanobacterium SM2_3_1]